MSEVIIRPATQNDSAEMSQLQEACIQQGVIETQIKVLVKDAYTALKADRAGSQTFLAFFPGSKRGKRKFRAIIGILN